MNRPPVLDLKPYFLTLDDLAGQLEWPAFFGNENPVELDVGCGRGLFLFTASTSHPDINYLGLELDYTEGRRAAQRLWKRSQPNARVIGGDARIALSKFIPPESVAAVHVYFPDPWWKRRHKRRRLFTDEFVELARGVLRPGGLFHSWTDVEDYFDVIRALMDHHSAFEPLAPPEETAPAHDLDYQTSFERKKRQLGATIYRGLWRKRDKL
ncbi:MAG TPA: tRNA (guanosine(46)-N7)-methyltransferase TrmB [Planctomycetaceae bacterium]|jgi:tRNA (guanine-N7-)-methyltransferase|nr:tRNA (guanosine(46)-N7)-methyltransferase TrmB [Planctomycetaceae bacterium]